MRNVIRRYLLNTAGYSRLSGAGSGIPAETYSLAIEARSVRALSRILASRLDAHSARGAAQHTIDKITKSQQHADAGKQITRCHQSDIIFHFFLLNNQSSTL